MCARSRHCNAAHFCSVVLNEPLVVFDFRTSQLLYLFSIYTHTRAFYPIIRWASHQNVVRWSHYYWKVNAKKIKWPSSTPSHQLVITLTIHLDVKIWTANSIGQTIYDKHNSFACLFFWRYLKNITLRKIWR